MTRAFDLVDEDTQALHHRGRPGGDEPGHRSLLDVSTARKNRERPANGHLTALQVGSDGRIERVRGVHPVHGRFEHSQLLPACARNLRGAQRANEAPENKRGGTRDSNGHRDVIPLTPGGHFGSVREERRRTHQHEIYGR